MSMHFASTGGCTTNFPVLERGSKHVGAVGRRLHVNADAKACRRNAIARLALKIAMEEFHAIFPDYVRLQDHFP
ncbi:hypothetical protein [Methylocella silvestris]|uniref:hypothetical protein n=1 Tax=Methylocella silvestris TaxID=199596 RepID=UPI0015E13054|nr:hypothetical protein [Methylocella silvestris]